MVVDAAGNLFVADSDKNRIAKVTPSGVVSIFAGTGQLGFADGAAASATFNLPAAVALDADANLYVMEAGNQLLRKITPAGQVSTLAGQPGQSILPGQSTDGIGAAARFNAAYGLVVAADGTIYVADTFANKIRKVTPIPAP